MENFRLVAKVSDIPVGKTHCVSVDGQEILLCHSKEGLYAVDNLCSHAAERLSEGKLKGCKVICPLHGAAFDIRDGAALTKPAREPLRSHEVRIEGEEVLVSIES